MFYDSAIYMPGKSPQYLTFVLFHTVKLYTQMTVWATVYKTVRPRLSDRCLSCLSCLSVTLVYCGQTVGWIMMPHGTEVGIDPGHILLDREPTSQFLVHVCCGQRPRWINIPLGTEVGVDQGDIVSDGDPAFSRKRGVVARSPLFGPRIL